MECYVIGNHHERSTSTQKQNFRFFVASALGFFCRQVVGFYWPWAPPKNWRLPNWPRPPPRRAKRGRLAPDSCPSSRTSLTAQLRNSAFTYERSLQLAVVKLCDIINSLFLNGFGEGLGVARLSPPFVDILLYELSHCSCWKLPPSGSRELLWPIVNWICRRSWATGFLFQSVLTKNAKYNGNKIRIRPGRAREQAQLQSSLQESRRVHSGAGFNFLHSEICC